MFLMVGQPGNIVELVRLAIVIVIIDLTIDIEDKPRRLRVGAQ